ncbi:MAG: 50S ribosomal protein L25 [Patescibacteria group bacterium]|nr:50S ribosomal protein L25 [Patescibacteria group bacterium]
MAKIDINLFHVNPRKNQKKSKKSLRSEGLIPANIFGLGEESEAIICPELELEKRIQKEGHGGLIYLEFEGGKLSVPVLIDELQHHPCTGKILHATFRRVNLNKAVETEVSIELVGETNIVDANVLQVLDSIQVSALPADIPEKIELDISHLTEVGQSILLKELPIDLTKIKLLVEPEELENPIVLVQAVVEEVEPEVEEVVAEEEGEKTEESEKPESDDAKTPSDKPSGEADKSDSKDKPEKN